MLQACLNMVKPKTGYKRGTAQAQLVETVESESESENFVTTYY